MISADVLGVLANEVTVTTWQNARKSQGGVVRRVTWADLAAEYSVLGDQVKAKNLLQAPSFCEVRSVCPPGECDRATEAGRVFNFHRCKSAVVSVSAVGLDYDGKEVDWQDVIGKLDALGLAYLVHDSPSHHSDAPKWRIYLPITEPWTDIDDWGDVYRAVKADVEELLGVQFDKQTSDPCRIFYPPTRTDELDQPRRVLWHSGKALNLRLAMCGRAVTPSAPTPAAPRTTLLERASSYLAKCDASISGQGGHTAALHAASSLVLGFELPPDQALQMLESEFNPRCKPPWSRKELEHKVKSAIKQGRMVRGCLLRDTRTALPPTAEAPVPSAPAAKIKQQDGPPVLALIRNKEGRPTRGFANLKEVLTNGVEFWGKLRLNDFAHVVEVHGKLPWKNDDAVRPWRDSDDVEAAAYIEANYGFSSSPIAVFQTVAAVGEARKYHPVRDYLVACRDKWDGHLRINTWLLDAGGCRTNEDGEEVYHKNTYVSAVGRRFLIAAVARIFKPGCKVDSVLILEGLQGKRKSSLVRELFSEPWFTDQLADVGSKAADEQLAGKWGIEIPELDATKGASATREKAFFSRSVDRFRPAYGRAVVEYPRTCVFVGTTNKGHYLKDETGARRFQPVAVLRDIDLATITRDRDQLWAEAVLAYEAGEQWWLTEEETALAAAEQEERYQTDVLEATVEEYVRTREETTVDAIMAHLFESAYGGHSQERYNQAVGVRIGKILRHLGWEMVRVRTKEKGKEGRTRVYRRPGWTCPTRPTCPGENPYDFS